MSGFRISRLPTLPKSPPPPPPSPPPPPISQEAQKTASQDASATAGDQDGPTQGKQELLDQLKGRRQEVEKLMAKRRAEREGITVAVRLQNISSATTDNRSCATQQTLYPSVVTQDLLQV